jgi:NAD(P)-dependent dehydrogenase (short-subunit alcohol dehydrogenase family)
MDRLKGKVSFITGSGSGIGRAGAQLFAKEGAKITVVDIVKEGSEETVRKPSSFMPT